MELTPPSVLLSVSVFLWSIEIVLHLPSEYSSTLLVLLPNYLFIPLGLLKYMPSIFLHSFLTEHKLTLDL